MRFGRGLGFNFINNKLIFDQNQKEVIDYRKGRAKIWKRREGPFITPSELLLFVLFQEEVFFARGVDIKVLDAKLSCWELLLVGANSIYGQYGYYTPDDNLTIIVNSRGIMAQVHINNIVVLNNPASVLDPFSFQITFECFNALPGVFDWKIIYIGSPNNPDSDQVIDSFDMDTPQAGVMQFNVESQHPNFNQIAQDEIVGTTAIIISVSYEKQEFFRCGYYVRNEYDESLLEPPKNLSLKDLKRYILAENPRIFRFEIEWAKREGLAYEDTNLLKKNIDIMGGDPFEQSNGAIQDLEKMSYSYGMFQNNQSA